MVVFNKFVKGLPQRAFSEQNPALHARFLDGSDKALRVRIQIRRARRQVHRLPPLVPRVSKNSGVNNGSRSWIKYRLPTRKPSPASLRLRDTRLIQSPFTCRASPAISTRRLDKSIRKSTRNLVKPLRVQASMVKKSVPSRIGARSCVILWPLLRPLIIAGPHPTAVTSLRACTCPRSSAEEWARS